MRGAREKVDPADWFDRTEIEQAREYSRALQRFNVSVVGTVVVVLIATLVARIPARVIDLTNVHAWTLQVLLVAFVLSIAIELVSFPFDAAFRNHQVRWDMQGPKNFWVDTVLGFAATITLLPIAVLLIAMLIGLSSLWWLPMSVLGVMFGVLARIAPLSRKHKRVQDEALEDRLRRLARDAGVRKLDVYVGARADHPTALDAVLVGFGRSSRIVLSETILARPIKEIEVHLARKISSWRKGITVRKLVSVAIAAPLGFLPSALVIESSAVQRWVGATGRNDPRMLPLFLLVLLPSVFGVGLLLNWQSRRHVREMDVDTLNFTRDPDAFEQVIRSTYARLHAELAPSFIQRLRSSLPPPAERLAAAARWRDGRRVAVLFTDVEDATPLVERLGDEAWYDVLQDHNEILRRHVEAHRGREPASAGDGFLFVFDDVGEALICAIEIQRDLHRYAVERGIDIRVRMGVHTGEVIRKGDAVIGREVHVAARIASAAAGGQILVSDKVHDALAATGRFRFGNEHVLTLKGLSGTYRSFDVDWAESPTGARPLQQRPA
jgi:adenylate cyclase